MYTPGLPEEIADFSDAEIDYLLETERVAAKHFCRLLYREILPTLRRSGSYVADDSALAILAATRDLIGRRRRMARIRA